MSFYHLQGLTCHSNSASTPLRDVIPATLTKLLNVQKINSATGLRVLLVGIALSNDRIN